MMKLLPVEDGHLAYCSGCKQSHLIPIRWQFNGDLNKPTFAPSLLINIEFTDPSKPKYVCHSFVTDGKWQYCSDSTHELAGQIIEMEDYE
jgi:hypothetical protein